MGYIVKKLAAPGQEVHGMIIALDGDARIESALRVTRNIEFYLYSVDFKLDKVLS